MDRRQLKFNFEDLPEGWKVTNLGKFCEFYNGKAHEKCIDENGEFIVVNSKFISSDGKIIKRTKENLFPLYKNDIVMVMSDVPKGKALAKCYIIEDNHKYSLNQRICAIRSDKFDIEFLYYHLNRHPYLLSFDNGENQTNLRKDDILKCPLFFPTLDEQKRIVSILDEAFEGIDQAIRNTEKNLANLNELKQSILQKAFTGQLIQRKFIKAEEFDAGEDLTEFMDFSTARHPNREKQKIELKLPLWMIRQLETEAQKQGISPQTFLENYLVENLTPIN